MSFLKAIFSIFGSSDSSSDSYDRSEARQERLDELSDIYLKVAQDTIELTNFPNKIKRKIISAFEQLPYRGSPTPKIDEELYPLIEDIEWAWAEWEHWSPICLEKKLATQGMHKICRPWPDVLNLEEERTKWTVDIVLKRITIKSAKEQLKEQHPEIEKITRKGDLADFLTKNNDAYLQLVDDLINTSWNKKKHNLGHSKKAEFKLLCDTIIARAYDFSDIKEARGCGVRKFQILFDEDTETEDQALYKLGRKKDNPWQQKYLPNVPGLSFERDDAD